jgi:hypothetical protein
VAPQHRRDAAGGSINGSHFPGGRQLYGKARSSPFSNGLCGLSRSCSLTITPNELELSGFCDVLKLVIRYALSSSDGRVLESPTKTPTGAIYAPRRRECISHVVYLMRCYDAAPDDAIWQGKMGGNV